MRFACFILSKVNYYNLIFYIHVLLASQKILSYFCHFFLDLYLINVETTLLEMTTGLNSSHLNLKIFVFSKLNFLAPQRGNGMNEKTPS